MRKYLLASAAAFGLVAGATGLAHAQASHPPAPGHIAVHLNGQFQYQIGIISQPTNSTKAGPVKHSALTDFGFLRLYPGFDGTTPGGLQYGVKTELRMTGAPSHPESGATSNSASATELYIRRAYAYVGTPTMGFLRFGQGDGAFSLLQDGVLEHFGDGQVWNSDNGLGEAISGGPHGLYADTGHLYTSAKIVYISPSFDGVNFAVSFEPNSNPYFGNNLSVPTTSAQPGSSRKARRNTIDGMVQYVGTFDDVGVKASAGYMVGSPLGDTTEPQKYKQLEVGQAGIQVSYAGFELGGNVKWGHTKDHYYFVSNGQRDAFVYMVGGTYTIAGTTVGAAFFDNQNAGGYYPGSGMARTLNEDGVAAGVNYSVTPHFEVFAQYLYGEEHQPGNTKLGPNGNAHQEGMSVGTALKW